MVQISTPSNDHANETLLVLSQFISLATPPVWIFHIINKVLEEEVMKHPSGEYAGPPTSQVPGVLRIRVESNPKVSGSQISTAAWVCVATN